MNKIEIRIDKNIKYLGEIKNIELPYGNSSLKIRQA